MLRHMHNLQKLMFALRCGAVGLVQETCIIVPRAKVGLHLQSALTVCAVLNSSPQF